jgi:hypothetical protein
VMPHIISLPKERSMTGWQPQRIIVERTNGSPLTLGLRFKIKVKV